MEINWRERFSMIITPGPLLLSFSSQGESDFWQQVAPLSGFVVFSGEAEDKRAIRLAAAISRAALNRNIFFFCMVMVFGFDESSVPNVTANLKYLFP